MAVLIWALTIICGLVTLLPLSRLPHGAIRILSFGRQQVIVIAGIVLACALVWQVWWAALVLAALILWQVVYIWRFFPTGRVQSRDSPPEACGDPDAVLRLVTANVKQSNRDYTRFISLIEQEKPDLLILIETDADWLAGLRPLHARYPYRCERPLDTGYGMALFSGRPIEDHIWHERLVEGVPSLTVTLRLKGERVRLYVIHPEPPVPHHDTKGRDAEIGLVGIEAAEDPLPGIVTGDLNDVAWSHTTRRFQRLSGYLDPRVGRGFYNTFHAQYWPLRWPLDHLFHHPRFRLCEMRRLPDFGSDHFPMLFGLSLSPVESANLVPATPDADDYADIRDMAEDERARDRKPIGEDWEQG